MIDFSPFPADDRLEQEMASVRAFAEESQRYLDEVLRQLREQFTRNLNQMVEQETGRLRQGYGAAASSASAPPGAGGGASPDLLTQAMASVLNRAIRSPSFSHQDMMKAVYQNAGRSLEKLWMQHASPFPSRFGQSSHDTPFDLFSALWRNDRNL